jgi:hypothetical protein
MILIGDKVKYIAGGLTFIGIVKEKLGNIYNIYIINVKISPNYPTNWTDDMLEKIKKSHEYFNIHEYNITRIDNDFDDKFKKFTITI